jgi:hypothetical protein
MARPAPPLAFVRDGRGMEEALGTADERIAAFIKAEEAVGGAGDTDSKGFANATSRMVGYAKPKRAGPAEVEAIVAAVDLQGGGEAPGAACKVEQASGFAVALHNFDTFQRFERADEDCRSGSRGFTDHIQHEVRTVIEKNVDVTLMEIHGADARSGSAKMMAGRVAGWIGFCFDDAAADASLREIVNDNFSNKEPGELDGVVRKFGTAQAPDVEFRMRRFRGGVRCTHEMESWRDGSRWIPVGPLKRNSKHHPAAFFPFLFRK